MNNQEKITPLQNSEDYEKLKADYQAEKEKLKAKAEEWKNVAIKRDEALFEKDKVIEKLAEERDDWKAEAHRNRRIEQEKKQTKQQNDFKSEFIKLQEQKGWKWDEARGWAR